MIRSMTGYGFAEKNTGDYQIRAEFKSLNGKNLELNVRIPKLISEKELDLRNRFMYKLERGTVMLGILIEVNPGKSEDLNLREELFIQYYQKFAALADKLGADKKDLFRSALMMPDVTRPDDKQLSEQTWADILDVCDQAFNMLDKYRLKEGQQTARVLKEQCEAIKNAIPSITQLEEERKQNLKNRLVRNLEEAASGIDYDKNRFEQELIYYLEKWDLQEEKSRLELHCDLFLDTLLSPAGGKKLGFVAQEMGREINTLGSKANHAGMQKIVIVMKENLEKIKEQVLNII